MRGVGFGLLAIALAEGLLEGFQLGILPLGVPGIGADDSLGVLAGDFHKLLLDTAVATEEGLRHPHLAHFVQDVRPILAITPVDDGIDVGLLQAFEFQRVVPTAHPVGHLHDNGVLQAPTAVVDLPHAKAAIAVAGPHEPDAFEAHLAVEIIHQQVTLLPIVADDAHHPRDVGLDHGGIGVPGGEHHHLRLECHADGNVRVGAINRAQNAPDVVLVSHLNDLVARGPPQAVVVGDRQLEGDFPFQVAAAGVSLLDGQPCPLEHLDPQRLFVTLSACRHGDRGHDRPNESDLDRLQVWPRLRDGTSGTGVLHLLEEVLLEGFGAAERLDVRGRVRVIRVFLNAQVGNLVSTRGVGLFEHLKHLGIIIRDQDGVSRVVWGFPSRRHPESDNQSES